MNTLKKWYSSGEAAIWLSGAAVSVSIIIVLGLLLLIAVNGLAHFWPAKVGAFEYRPSADQVVQLVGEVRDEEVVATDRAQQAGEWLVDPSQPTQQRLLLKVGNRDLYGLDFRWVLAGNIVATAYPGDLLVIERQEWGNYFGYLKSVKTGDGEVVEDDKARGVMSVAIEKALNIRDEIHGIERGEIGRINHAMERQRLKKRRLELGDRLDAESLAELARDRGELDAKYEVLQTKLALLYGELNRDELVLTDAGGRVTVMPVGNVVRAYYPNSFSLTDKIGFYGAKIWEFVSAEPREANTEGGIFPAIFGTVVMVLVMSVLVTPFGVLAAIYLREYAKQGFVTRLVRIAVNNLAGVPSIVYGVFGLGFFVYFLGGNIDQLFYPEVAPAPVFGTPGLLWSSLTLALLTLPVVIVSTEEGLSRVPRAVREGSLALGATKLETLLRIVIPMASPAMMTGMILAVARAAGEVAPLMLVGVVKLAPSLPIDMNAPFLHLDRKFMHMGFHIYDVGFQSPNVEAARPLVYATALMLVAVIVIMNLTAIRIRNSLREKYRGLEQ
ncbi:MAG: phosphate ABC transporter permease PtsA [Gammaproteobacteria bacterium]|nr:MAG: phosphate ABC transporter permease PtsA [Gammaproteobacteria bacterium]RLA17392.1 MAG: phosphate ABC transporter permease PtsA [Gammaproteobacteria bacterium]